MDLGISGRNALVCGASAGLGYACANALAHEGVAVTITGRDVVKLEAAADRLRAETGAKITIAAGDITTEEGRAAALAVCPAPDILVTNAGGPPSGDFRQFTDVQWQAALNANMLTPIALIRAVVDGMVARRFGRIVNITSAAVKAPMQGLTLSNTARTGLTGFVAGVSREVAWANVIINNILPGPFDTGRLRRNLSPGPEIDNQAAERGMAAWAARIPARRVGNPAEFGAACAFLCSAHAGFIVGQNILLDGGEFNSTM
ncbi:SDR family oxidoreductase [Acidocella aromatica]|uniref:3-oxoacyl-[acyl-carrier protein] reductase n=1 Tax=Acidocella aromatica TaxID=1303579 RepID=A0A840VQB4_9PROT|nr:SDR family oxidoreductase [Acidocella aromatica]MBB5373590.1 3-oxoacyl-[acyl-carrier protein] reductase [Acidocella aromatica]